MHFKKSILLIIILKSLTFSALAQSELPVPSEKDQLFYLQRSSNANTIIYELNYNDGALDEKNPVHPFWIMYEDKDEQDELNEVQRKFAYGMKTIKIADDHYELSFVSYKKYKLELEPGADHKLHVYAIINNIKAMLTSVFIQINGGTFWKPNIEYFEVTGIDPTDNSIIKQRLKI